MRRGNQAAGTRRISFRVALGAEKGTAGVPCEYRCVQRVCSKCGKNTAVCEEINVEAKSQRAKKCRSVWKETFNSQCADMKT